MTSGAGAFSWNSELPSGRNPFWIRDEGLSGVGLHAGDAVSVDTRADPHDGDLVVVEAEIDGDSVRIARRYFASGTEIRLEAVRTGSGRHAHVGLESAVEDSGPSHEGTAVDRLALPVEAVLIMGVIVARLHISPNGDQVTEAPLA